VTYKGFVSWGMYGGATSQQRANLYASWGLMTVVGAIVGSSIPVFMAYYRRLRG